MRGRCLSYGEGITYWPVIEVVKQLHARPDDEHAATAIRSLLGETETLAGTDEIAWAFRKLLEAQAPLVVCFDDIQWGEETFLDLVESTALLSTGAPLLLLCMARPELLDRRPGWPAVLRLEPLPEDEAGALVGDAVTDEVRERIVRASGGNPLFLTEMARAQRGWTARSRCRRRCARCSRRGSTSSTSLSGGCSSVERSRASSSTAAPCKRSRRRRQR